MARIGIVSSGILLEKIIPLEPISQLGKTITTETSASILRSIIHSRCAPAQYDNIDTSACSPLFHMAALFLHTISTTEQLWEWAQLAPFEVINLVDPEFAECVQKRG